MIKVIVLTLGLLLASCATSQKKKVKVDVSKYTNSLVVKGIKKSSSNKCPRSKTAWKKKSWKKIMKMTNQCAQEAKWVMVEELGNHLSTHEALSPWGSYYLSLSAQARGNYPRALWMIDLALKKAPDLGILHYQMGRVQWTLENFEESVKSFKSAIKYDKNIKDAYAFLGQVYLKAQDFSQAAKYFQATLSVDSKNKYALAGLAECREYQKEYREAVELLARAISAYPRTLDLRARRAYLLETYEKDYVNALTEYKKIRSLIKRKQLKGSLGFNLNGKIKSLETVVAQIAPQGEKVSKSEAASKVEVKK